MNQPRLPDYSVTGAGDTTVFLLHGAFGSKDYWRNQIRCLSLAGYRVVAWDAPGYGFSPLPQPFNIEVAAEAAANLIKAQGTAQNIILGHSMGGMIAQRCYSYVPELVHGLVLSATSAAFGNNNGDWQKKFVADRVAPLDAGVTLPELSPKMIRKMVAPDSSGESIDLVIKVIGQMREETFRAAIEAITQFEARDVLPTMTVPVLVMSGGHDHLAAPPKIMEKMASKIARAEYHCMEHVGHFGWAEDPEGFNNILLDFMTQHYPTGTG